jgi:hypothetical protein
MRSADDLVSPGPTHPCDLHNIPRRWRSSEQGHRAPCAARCEISSTSVSVGCCQSHGTPAFTRRALSKRAVQEAGSVMGAPGDGGRGADPGAAANPAARAGLPAGAAPAATRGGRTPALHVWVGPSTALVKPSSSRPAHGVRQRAAVATAPSRAHERGQSQTAPHPSSPAGNSTSGLAVNRSPGGCRTASTAPPHSVLDQACSLNSGGPGWNRCAVLGERIKRGGTGPTGPATVA